MLYHFFSLFILFSAMLGKRVDEKEVNGKFELTKVAVLCDVCTDTHVP